MNEKITEYSRQYNTPRIWQMLTTALLFLAHESMWILPAFYSDGYPLMLHYYAGATVHLSALGFIIGTIFIWLNRPKFAVPSSIVYLIPMIVAYIKYDKYYYYDDASFAYGYFLILILIVASIVLSFISHEKTVAGSRPITDLPVKPAIKEEPAFNADKLKKLKELLDAGAITEEEFNEKKKQLL